MLQLWLGRERFLRIRDKIRRNTLARGLSFALYTSIVVHDLRWPWMLALVLGIVGCTWFIDSRIGQKKPQAACALAALCAFVGNFCGTISNGASVSYAIAWSVLGGVIVDLVTMFKVPPLSRAVRVEHSLDR